MQDVPRTNDHAPSRTFYTFCVNAQAASARLGAELYRAAGNVHARLAYELNQRAEVRACVRGAGERAVGTGGCAGRGQGYGCGRTVGSTCWGGAQREFVQWWVLPGDVRHWLSNPLPWCRLPPARQVLHLIELIQTGQVAESALAARQLDVDKIKHAAGTLEGMLLRLDEQIALLNDV